ncbi:hypothetical protein SK128_015511, partial [Halocaridina rubra]
MGCMSVDMRIDVDGTIDVNGLRCGDENIWISVWMNLDGMGYGGVDKWMCGRDGYDE